MTDAWDVLHEVQSATPLIDNPLDLVTVEQIMEMLPDALKGSVSKRWLRENVTGKKRIGKRDMWPRRKVLEYFTEFFE